MSKWQFSFTVSSEIHHWLYYFLDFLYSSHKHSSMKGNTWIIANESKLKIKLMFFGILRCNYKEAATNVYKMSVTHLNFLSK